MADYREENSGAVLSSPPPPPSESSHVLGDLISSFLTLKTEGPLSVRASSGRDTKEVSESSGQLAQDSMYGSAW